MDDPQASAPEPEPAPGPEPRRRRPRKRAPGAPKLKRIRKPPDERALKLGEWLRKRRDALHLSQRDAAAVGGCSDAWLCQLESGFAAVTCIRADNVRKVAAAYRINIFTMLEALAVLTAEEAKVARAAWAAEVRRTKLAETPPKEAPPKEST